MHVQSKLLQRAFVVDASSDLGFALSSNKLGLGWGENRLSRYDIRAEGALPHSITVIARLKKIGLMDLKCFS